MRKCRPLGKLKLKSRVMKTDVTGTGPNQIDVFLQLQPPTESVSRAASDNALCKLIGSGHTPGAKLGILLYMLQGLLLAFDTSTSIAE